VTLRHRYLIAAPFAVILLATILGGLLNTTDARARIVDDMTDLGVKDATITHGVRSAKTDANGEFVITNVPRTSKYQVDALGYLRTSAPTTAEEIRLRPLSITLYAYDETKTQDDRVKNPQARDPRNTKILATGNESGQIIVAPHPGKDAQVMLCAEGFEPKVITVQGVLMQIGLRPGGLGCPPLPSPSPAPGATPSPSGPAPSPTGPAPSPTSSP
jgi:hypothetical protein